MIKRSLHRTLFNKLCVIFYTVLGKTGKANNAGPSSKMKKLPATLLINCIVLLNAVRLTVGTPHFMFCGPPYLCSKRDINEFSASILQRNQGVEMNVLTVEGLPYSQIDKQVENWNNNGTYLSLYLKDVHLNNTLRLRRLKNIRMIMLDNNDIEEIRENSFGEGLEQIWIKNNNLQSVSLDAFTNITNLSLSIADDQIKNIPQLNFGSHRSLKELTLRNNFIKNITQASLRNVKNVDLSMNYIAYFTSDIFSFDILEDLDVSNNRIQTLNTSMFEGLSSLKKLNISHNSITKINIDTFSDTKNLRTLDLSNNQITYLSTSTGKFPLLEYLDLSQNDIQNVTQIPFESMPNLKQLYLTGNFLENILPLTFNKNLKLEKVVIHDFKYTRVDGTVNTGYAFCRCFNTSARLLYCRESKKDTTYQIIKKLKIGKTKCEIYMRPQQDKTEIDALSIFLYIVIAVIVVFMFLLSVMSCFVQMKICIDANCRKSTYIRYN